MRATRPDGHESADPARRPLRIAVLVKQVPLAEALELDEDGRLRRDGAELEMNPYCRRAVSKGVEIAAATGGRCTVYTMGPPAAEDVLREAVAWGADEGVHLCDPAFAGSDTLATARALVAAIRRDGPFDLVLAGRNSTDGDTGQIGPEVAALLDLPFAGGVRRLDVDGDRLCLGLEQDDSWEEVETSMPAVLSVAERLCDPCKVEPGRRAEVPGERLRRLSARDVGDGPFGAAGSPTRVGATRALEHDRDRRRLSGLASVQAAEAAALLSARGALGTAGPVASPPAPGTASRADHPPRRIAVLLEPDRPQIGLELACAAVRLAGAGVHALCPRGAGSAELVSLVDEILDLDGDPVAEDVADALVGWSRKNQPWAVLAPSTAFGREVAGRTAAVLGAGLVGDAIAVDVVDGVLLAAKPALSGALVADITCTSPVQMVTVRPGVLPVPVVPPTADRAVRTTLALARRGRLRVVERRREDDVEVLARAEVVIGVGTGLEPDEHVLLAPLAEVLGAELAASRKVTDRGWMPRSRQVGITGRSISPQLYVSIGCSGKFNHMVGVRGAGTVLAINSDATAPVFDHADIGMVGDWHELVPALLAELRQALGAPSPSVVATGA